MLTRHVLKIHISDKNISNNSNGKDGDEEDGTRQWYCEWQNCPCSHGLSKNELQKHVLDDHIEPYAWKLGDGPFVPGIGERERKRERGRKIINLFTLL